MIAAFGFLLTIVGANWAIVQFGLVPVGFGLAAPAGVYFAGLAFTLRDLTHERFGAPGVLGLIAFGAMLSAAISPQFALASTAAFFCSELADLMVYAPFRRRGWLRAVAASNVVGLVVDSIFFLWLAFGSLDYLLGQLVGKAWVTAAVVGAVWVGRRYIPTRVYLAGGINGLSDADAMDWREYVKSQLGRGFRAVDPMVRDYRGRELEPGIDRMIVRGDQWDILWCRWVIVNAARPSWGTAMEVMFAWIIGKRLVVVVPGSQPSPWLTFHATHLVTSFDDAVAVVRRWA